MSLLKYAIFFNVMVLTAVATVNQYAGKTGYYASSFYYSDSKCKTAPLSQTFIPLGVCNNLTSIQNGKRSIMYTTDPSNSNQVYHTEWYASGSCNSAASFVASSPSDTTNAVSINSTCVRNKNNYNGVQPYIQQSIGYVATLPTIAFPQQMRSTYDFSGCAKGAVSNIEISTMRQDSDGSYGCNADSHSDLQCLTTSICPIPTGALANGYAQTTSFNNVPCTAANSANQGSQFTKLGVCDPGTPQTYPGESQYWASHLTTGYTSGTTTIFVQSEYRTTNCGGIPLHYSYYTAGYCPTTWSNTDSTFNQYSLVSNLPTAPTGGVSQFDYATPAACAATDPTQIVSAYYAPSYYLSSNYTQTTKCYNPNPSDGPGPAQYRTLCGPQTLSSTTGGFIVIKSYADSACATAPTNMMFYQLNVCAVQNATFSVKIISSTANGVTVASQGLYRNTACTGTPFMTYPNFANTTKVCKGSGTNNGVTNQWSTTTFTSVVGVNSGAIRARYVSPSTCATQTQASLFIGYQLLSNTCGNIGYNNSLLVINTCGVPTAKVIAQVVYVTQIISSASLTLTTVQSPAFQTTFEQAVATTAGVAVSAVEVNRHRIPVLSPTKP